MTLQEQAGPASGAKDVTTASFRQDVIAESMKQPVLVDFWAPWCGPCKQLAPALEKAVAATKGGVRLTKMNIDDHPQIAGQLGIQSIPAVIAFDKGQPVDGFVGALPESQIKAFLERIAGKMAGGTKELLEAAAQVLAAGDVVQAIEAYGAVLEEDPGNTASIGALAKIYIDQGELETAKGYLESVPDDRQNDAEIVAARAALELAEQTSSVGDIKGLEAAVASNPNDHQARFDYALALSAKGQHDDAVDALIEIVKRDRAWNDDGARKQLIQFFDAWGPMDEKTKAGRRKLSALLFR
ncbi:MAG: thioredoxin [Alphaproteobacteria bacterium]